MGKKYIIYANGKDLAECPVVQNETGVYYSNGSAYFKPVLKDFDTATPPSGYKRYTGGSHASYIGNTKRHPIDISFIVGTKLTANFDVKVISSTSADGSWIKTQIVGTNYILPFVHCYKGLDSNGKPTYPVAGSIIKAGSVICSVAPQSITKNPPHLHADEWTGYLIRNLILYGDFIHTEIPKPAYSVGQRFIALDTMNIRDNHGEDIGDILKNAVGEIVTVGTFHDGYQWYELKFLNGFGYVADTKFNEITTLPITNLDGSIPAPIPTPTPTPEPTPEPPVPPVEVPDEPSVPTEPPVITTPPQPTTEPTAKKTFLEILIELFTDFFQSIKNRIKL